MKRWKFDPLALVLPALMVVLWYFASASGLLPAYKLPSPVDLFYVLADFATGAFGITPYAGTLLTHLLCSLRRVACGFAIAAAAGLVLGFATGLFPLLRRLLDPLIHVIRAVPGIGWLPVAIVWFGVGEGNTLFLISLAAFFPIYVNTAHAAVAVPGQLTKAGRMMGARGLTLFRTVIFPASFPEVAVGLRLGLGVAWAYLVLGEVTGVATGLGAVMNDGRMLGHVDIVLAAMIVIAAAGKLTDLLLLAACRAYCPQMRKRRNGK